MTWIYFVRINHTVILDDPFDDPPDLLIPDRSPEPTREQLDVSRVLWWLNVHAYFSWSIIWGQFRVLSLFPGDTYFSSYLFIFLIGFLQFWFHRNGLTSGSLNEHLGKMFFLSSDSRWESSFKAKLNWHLVRELFNWGYSGVQ